MLRCDMTSNRLDLGERLSDHRISCVEVHPMATPKRRSAERREPRGELSSRTLAMPADTNPNGDMFGGWIMWLMDGAASMTATRHAQGRVVTVAVSNITF